MTDDPETKMPSSAAISERVIELAELLSPTASPEGSTERTIRCHHCGVAPTRPCRTTQGAKYEREGRSSSHECRYREAERLGIIPRTKATL